MSRLRRLFGMERGAIEDSSALVDETKDLRKSIDTLAGEVRELVHAVIQSNRNPNPSRNPIQDMTRGRYKGARRGH